MGLYVLNIFHHRIMNSDITLGNYLIAKYITSHLGVPVISIFTCIPQFDLRIEQYSC